MVQEELQKYLEQNCNSDTYTGRSHQGLIRQVRADIRRLIDDPDPNLQVYEEVKYKTRDNQSGQVDLVIQSVNDLYLVEVKASKKEDYKLRNALRNQLDKGYTFFRNEFQIAPRMIGVYRIPNSPGFERFEFPRDVYDVLNLNS